jgi:AbrB family looped-hinge helix DNA binding protein
LTSAIFHAIFDAMNTTVTIDSSGRLVIPRDIRNQLHLITGSRLNLEVKGDGMFLAPLPSENARLVKRAGRLVIESDEPMADDTVRKAVLSDREDRMNKLSGRK